MTTVQLQPQERELVAITLDDLRHIARETSPDCDDHQLRRVSVPLRRLLMEDHLVRSWKLLQLQPKSPTIIAPRLRTDGFGPDDFAVAGGGDAGGAAVSNFSHRYRPALALSPVEVRAKLADLEHAFSLSEYKQSCAVYAGGQKVSRHQLVLYVANKKGGAHLDHRRKKDDQAYSALDAAIESGRWFGPSKKNTVYLELLSIGQHLTSSADIRRFMDEAPRVLGL
jgi:hypothetical protein